MRPATNALTIAAAGIGIAITAGAATARADCGPDVLGTARTITLKREAAAYGTMQHQALPLRKGEVVLTFDDGPRPETTPLVLKALADQCARATFLLVGANLERNIDLARREIAEGHSAGIHSFTHPHLATLSPEDQLADLRKTEDAYRAAFGTAPPAYRFPFLEETPTMLAALQAANTTVLSADLGIDDWQPSDTTEILKTRLVDRLKASGGGMIVMHDANNTTAVALPVLLKALKDNGYSVVHIEWAAN
jgi:peptidoglycan/xylan/chitin deacetylase (PgdA/CDA1 family)